MNQKAPRRHTQRLTSFSKHSSLHCIGAPVILFRTGPETLFLLCSIIIAVLSDAQVVFIAAVVVRYHATINATSTLTHRLWRERHLGRDGAQQQHDGRRAPHAGAPCAQVVVVLRRRCANDFEQDRKRRSVGRTHARTVSSYQTASIGGHSDQYYTARGKCLSSTVIKDPPRTVFQGRCRL